jgi:hypothetical protein
MIKSLAIYGDSFGTHSLSRDYDSQLKGLSYHWSTLLQQEYNCELTNYALSGSSVYYSYKEFERTNHQHDLIIFLVTEPNRYIKPLHFFGGEQHCITNQAQIDVWKKTRSSSLSNDDLKLLKKLEHWFELSDEEHQYDISELIVDKVSSVGQHVIVIPCFAVSHRAEYKEKLQLPNNVNLCSLYYAQMDEFQFRNADMNIEWDENPEFISGHLTPEYNKIAYENINYYIKNRVWNWDIPNSKIIDTPNKDNYYIKL